MGYRGRRCRSWVDASALVELLLQSKRAPAVLRAAGDTEMVAPDGINPEVLSTLRRLERIGELPAGRAIQAVDDLLDAAVRRLATLPLLPQAWALRANVTSYDACYVALARDLGCPLVTGTRGCRGLRGWACRWSPSRR